METSYVSAQPGAGWALLLFSLTYLIIASRSRVPHDNLLKSFPVVGIRDGWFPRIRATIQSISKTSQWASEGYSKFTKQNSPYIISTMDRGPAILLPPGQMKTVYKLPEDRLDVFGTLQDQIQARYTVRDQNVILDPYHRYLIPGQLTRQLDYFTDPMFSEVEDAFRTTWGMGSVWRDISIWQACFQVIARTTNSALVGKPLCRNEKYLSLLEGQSIAVFGGSTLINITPEPLRSVFGYLVRLWCLYYSRSIAKLSASLIEARIKETKATKAAHQSSGKIAKDGLQLVIDEALSRNDPAQLSTRLIADRLIITNNVTLHGVAFTAHHLILCLVSSDPSLGYIDALRKECSTTLQAAGGRWNLEAVRKLKLLDSTIRESMRMVPFASVAMARTVVDPNGISLQHGSTSVSVPSGTVLAVPIESIHYDQDIYPEAHQFNPFRFMSRSPVDAEAETSDPTNVKPTTSADDIFFGFGTSKNPCPGRFLAVHMIKLIIAHMLLNYDIQPVEGQPQLSNMLAMKVPDTKVKLKVRRRLG